MRWLRNFLAVLGDLWHTIPMKLNDPFALPAPERLLLIQDLWDSMLTTPDAVPVYAWHQQELDRRTQDQLAKPDAGRPWDEVRAKILDTVAPI